MHCRPQRISSYIRLQRWFRAIVNGSGFRTCTDAYSQSSTSVRECNTSKRLHS